MFNFNIITAKQSSVDPYKFYKRVLWTSFKLAENLPIDSMLTKDNICCLMLTSLLNNHIKKLIGVIYKIINTAKCSAHALSKQCKTQFRMQCKIIAKWIK